MDIPSSSEYVESFDCKETQVNRYKVHFIKNSLKALAASTKVALRVIESGVMSFQFLIPVPETQGLLAFVEFFVSVDSKTVLNYLI